jgi:hypothetical protein
MEKLYQKAKEEGVPVSAGKTSENGYKHKTRASYINHPGSITKPKRHMWTDWRSKSKSTLWT